MKSEAQWIAAWRGFFESVAEPLSNVLDAQGCREGWLQAEAFRYFRQREVALYVNYLVLPGPAGLKNRKADFASYTSHSDDAALEFVGELKVYGEAGFYKKNLTGGNFQEALRRLRRDGSVTFKNIPRDRQLVAGPGLLADYFRLVDYDAGADSPTRFLMLCVRRATKPDEFGATLAKAEFERAGVLLLDREDMYVKAWSVGA